MAETIVWERESTLGTPSHFCFYDGWWRFWVRTAVVLDATTAYKGVMVDQQFPAEIWQGIFLLWERLFHNHTNSKSQTNQADQFRLLVLRTEDTLPHNILPLFYDGTALAHGTDDST